MKNICTILVLLLFQAVSFGQYGISVITVLNEKGEMFHEFGTACLIEKDVVLTCNHAVDGLDYHVIFNGKRYNGAVIAQDPRMDLALMRLDRKVIRIRPIAIGTVALGEKVAIGGYGGGEKDWLYQHGEVSMRGYTMYGGYGTAIKGAVARPGDSGGPVVNLEGYLVGIVWAYVDEVVKTNPETGELINEPLPKEKQLTLFTEVAGFVAQHLDNTRYKRFANVDPYYYDKQARKTEIRWQLRERQLESFIELNGLPTPARPIGWGQ